MNFVSEEYFKKEDYQCGQCHTCNLPRIGAYQRSINFQTVKMNTQNFITDIMPKEYLPVTEIAIS